MFAFLSNQERQLAAARRAIQHVAEQSDMPLSIRMWDGTTIPLGPSAEDSKLTVSIRGPGVIGALVRWPTLDHFVRQYATGGIDLSGGDLIDFGTALRSARQKPKLKHLKKSILIPAAVPFLFAPAESAKDDQGFEGAHQHVAAAARQDKDYVQFHYDVGNEFYRLFLDDEMVYSCGYFTDENQSLNQAQRDKLDMICRKLRLQPGERMLDIGCGWGGLICHAAQHYGVEAHGVTLAQKQFEHTQEKIARLGLKDRVKVELKDYRDVEGAYDKIASIGMFEHVGIANLPAYFGKLNSLLRDRGILLNHGIARRAKRGGQSKQNRRPEKKLITKYIFPGGELDHIGHTLETIEASKFNVHDVENWREHYMLTTAHWCRRLTANREEAIRLVGPEKYRLWIAYLAGVSFGFQDGTLHIFQVVASKHARRGVSDLPLTRADLYAPPKPGVRKTA